MSLFRIICLPDNFGRHRIYHLYLCPKYHLRIHPKKPLATLCNHAINEGIRLHDSAYLIHVFCIEIGGIDCSKAQTFVNLFEPENIITFRTEVCKKTLSEDIFLPFFFRFILEWQVCNGAYFVSLRREAGFNVWSRPFLHIITG